MHLDASQHAAIARATSAPFSIITGGAGTGKTVITATIADTMEANGETVVLLAPTGKAAARQREACKRPASTIHRHLQFNGSKYLRESLKGESLVMDESSMIDALLMAEVVRRNPRRLILVGDDAQLQPVGRGAPFYDILRARPDLVSQLKHCYRNTEAIFKNAAIIREGGRPAMSETTPGEHWELVQSGDPERTQNLILSWVNSDAWDFDQDAIICARNEKTEDEPGTVQGLNRAIAALVSPRREGQKFNVGDRVVNTHNIYELDFYNGNTGKIHAIDQDGGIWILSDFPVIDRNKTQNELKPVYTSHVLFSKENRKYLQLAYAITCHRSQGSQYRNVIVTAFDKDVHCKMMTRSWIYTAATRARTACCIMGQLSAVYAGIDNHNQKYTIIQKLAGT